MADDVPKIMNELLELSRLTQTKLAKKVGTSQSNISKWKSGKQKPLKDEWERVMAYYLEVGGAGSIDRKLTPYDDETKRIINEIVDDYLKRIPPPTRR
jgi:transcriptional regulator with XRE-family HTH domain